MAALHYKRNKNNLLFCETNYHFIILTPKILSFENEKISKTFMENLFDAILTFRHDSTNVNFRLSYIFAYKSTRA